MTENPNVGAQAEAGAGGQPSQPVSPTPVQPIDGEATKLLAELGGRLGTLEKELRGLQGRQDKGEKNLTSFQEQLAKFNQLKAQYGTDEQALAAMNQQAAEENRWSTLEQKLNAIAERVAGIGSTPHEQQMMAEVLSEFKLDPKDPYVAAQMQGKTFANRTEAEAWAGRVLAGKINSPQPNPAQSSTPPGTPGAPDLRVQYTAELSTLTQNRANSAQAVSDLKAKYRRLGLEVW